MQLQLGQVLLSSGAAQQAGALARGEVANASYYKASAGVDKPGMRAA